jgi:hypothetical protein
MVSSVPIHRNFAEESDPIRSTGILPKRVIRFDPIRGLRGQSETIVCSGQHMKEKNEKLLDFGIF